MLRAGTHDLVRDRAGKSRRLYEREHVDQPLSPSAKRQAMASYSGTVKFTYRESVGFERPAHIHMLKKYIPKTGEFVRW